MASFHVVRVYVYNIITGHVLANKSVGRLSRGTSHGLYSRTLSITSMVLCVDISLFCI